jgi:hypothetical protein
VASAAAGGNAKQAVKEESLRPLHSKQALQPSRVVTSSKRQGRLQEAGRQAGRPSGKATCACFS